MKGMYYYVCICSSSTLIQQERTTHQPLNLMTYLVKSNYQDNLENIILYMTGRRQKHCKDGQETGQQYNLVHTNRLHNQHKHTTKNTRNLQQHSRSKQHLTTNQSSLWKCQNSCIGLHKLIKTAA